MTKPYIKENEDGSAITITLKKGYTPAGTSSFVQQVEMREPMVADQQRARVQGNGDDVTAEAALLASVTGLTPDELFTMTARDYARVQAGYNHFMD